jgi:CheY-like chemotaxis protein
MTDIRILFVDDEPDLREIVDVSLGLDPQFRTRACASGADALVMAARWSPSVILLDVMMPLMDGPTTLANLRKNPVTAHIPVLFLTARTQSAEIEQYVSLGVQGVLSKPFDPMTLAALVRGHLPLQEAPLVPERKIENSIRSPIVAPQGAPEASIFAEANHRTITR